MQIQRITGKDMRDALERAAKLHGDGALVLGREIDAKGAVTVSVLPRPKSAVDHFAKLGFAPNAEDERPAVKAARERDPAMFDVRTRLRAAGFGRAFEDQIVEIAQRLRESGVHPIDAAAGVLGRLVPIAPGPRSKGRTAMVGLVGPEADANRGIAFSLARKLADAGRRVTVVSIEPHPTPEGDALEDEVLGAGIGMLRGDDGARIGARLVDTDGEAVVLISTGGRVTFDGRQLLRLGMVLRDADQLGSLVNYLVVPASRPRATLDRAWRTFERFRPRGIVATNCDRTEAFGPLLEFSWEHELGLVFLTGRSGDPHQLVRPTPSLLADLAFGGEQPWK